MLGKCCYTVNCPQWYKLTSMRVTHSAWDLGWCCECICYPKGRKLDTFDADIITDVSAHQVIGMIALRKSAPDLSVAVPRFSGVERLQPSPSLLCMVLRTAALVGA